MSRGFFPGGFCPDTGLELMVANTKVHRLVRILETSGYVMNLENVYETEDYQEYFYILNIISFYRGSDLNDVINSYNFALQ